MEKKDRIADIIDNVRRVFQILHEQSKKAEKETGLTSPQLWAIKVIADSAPVRVSELARLMYLHPATVVGILDRLEARGLAKRSGCEKDHRVVLVDLTDKGRSLVVSAPGVAQGFLVSGLEQLSGDVLEEINGGLSKLVQIFGAQKIPPKLIMSSEMNVPGERQQKG